MADLELLSVNDVPNNSFLVIRVDVPGPMEKYIAAQGIAKSLAPFEAQFREKNVVIMVMTPNEGFEVLTEAEMNAIGWFRK